MLLHPFLLKISQATTISNALLTKRIVFLDSSCCNMAYNCNQHAPITIACIKEGTIFFPQKPNRECTKVHIRVVTPTKINNLSFLFVLLNQVPSIWVIGLFIWLKGLLALQCNSYVHIKIYSYYTRAIAWYIALIYIAYKIRYPFHWFFFFWFSDLRYIDSFNYV